MLLKFSKCTDDDAIRWKSDISLFITRVWIFFSNRTIVPEKGSKSRREGNWRERRGADLRMQVRKHLTIWGYRCRQRLSNVGRSGRRTRRCNPSSASPKRNRQVMDSRDDRREGNRANLQIRGKKMWKKRFSSLLRIPHYRTLSNWTNETSRIDNSWALRQILAGLTRIRSGPNVALLFFFFSVIFFQQSSFFITYNWNKSLTTEL